MQVAGLQAAALTRAACDRARKAARLPGGSAADALTAVSRDARNGDIAISVIQAAMLMGMSGYDVAAIIAAHLLLDGSYFCAATAAAPGFLNFTLGGRYYAAVLAEIERAGAAYGTPCDEAGRALFAEYAATAASGPLAAYSADAARFFCGDRPGDVLTADVDLAARQDGANPLYRIRYASARIGALVAMAAQDGVRVLPAADIDVDLLCTGAERDLMKRLAALPGTVRLAVQHRDPSRVNRYLVAAADGFYRFYHTCRIRGQAPARAAARLKLADTTRVALAAGLTLIGISAKTTRHNIQNQDEIFGSLP